MKTKQVPQKQKCNMTDEETSIQNGDKTYSTICLRNLDSNKKKWEQKNNREEQQIRKQKKYMENRKLPRQLERK